MPDEELVKTLALAREAQGGNRQALEQLFERYLPRVRHIVAIRMGFRLRDLALQEDLTQDALARAFENLDQFVGESEASFRHWMSSCVVSAMNDRFRREKAAKRGSGKVRAFSGLQGEDLTAIVFAGDHPTPSSIVGRQELIERIEEELLAMKPHHREVILLRLFCGMSHREVSDAMGFGDEITARKAFSRAMADLRQRVER